MTSGRDIRAWLAEQGVPKYVGAFTSNDIGLDVLRELTDADLKDLGVASLGDRKRLLKAITSLASVEKILDHANCGTCVTNRRRAPPDQRCCPAIWFDRRHSPAA
jgi:hypothetical protein